MNLDFSTWPEHLAEAVKKNPRAALNFAAIIVVVGLVGVVGFLFSLTREQNAASSEKDALEIRDLKADIAILQDKHDSLVVLVGAMEATWLREKVAIKEQQVAELAAFNKNQTEKLSEMERELNKYRKLVASTKQFSETVKNLQTQ